MQKLRRCLAGSRGNVEEAQPTKAQSKNLAEALIQISGGRDELRLGDKGLGDVCMAKIAEAIGATAKVVSLELFKNKLTDASASHVYDIMATTPLEVLDLSDNELTGRTASTLKPGLEAPSCTLKRLLLKHNMLCDFGASEIAEVLKWNRSLIELHLGENSISDAGTTALAEALKSNKTLQKLHLGNNLIKDKGMNSLADMIEVNESLKELWLLECNTTHAAVKSFANAMERNVTLTKFAFTIKEQKARRELEMEALKVIKKSHTVRRQMLGVVNGGTSLNLSQHALGNNGVTKLAEIIAKSETIKEVKLENCQLPPEGLAKIAAAMKAKEGLQKVSLHGTRVDESSAQTLVEVLKTSPKLTSLNLTNCHMNETSVESVAELVGESKTLQRVHMAGNEITEAGAERLAEGIGKAHVLKDISLGNSHMSEAAVTEIVKAVESTQRLEKVNLSNMPVKGENVDRITQVIAGNQALKEINLSNCGLDSQAGVAIASALKQNDTVKRVGLGGNAFDEAVGSSLAETIQGHKAIAEVNLENCQMNATSVTKVIDAMSSNSHMKTIAIGGNQLTREDERQVAKHVEDVLASRKYELDTTESREVMGMKGKGKGKAKKGKGKGKGKSKGGKANSKEAPKESPRSPRIVTDDQDLMELDRVFDAIENGEQVPAAQNGDQGRKSKREAGGVAVAPPVESSEEEDNNMDEEWNEWLPDDMVPDSLDFPSDSDEDGARGSAARREGRASTAKRKSTNVFTFDLDSEPAQLDENFVPDELDMPDDGTDDEGQSNQAAQPVHIDIRHTTQDSGADGFAKASRKKEWKPLMDYDDVPEDIGDVLGEGRRHSEALAKDDLDIVLADEIELPYDRVPDTLPVLDEGGGAASAKPSPRPSPRQSPRTEQQEAQARFSV